MRNSAIQSIRLQSVNLDRINLQDDTFRITTREEVAELLKSIQFDGLIAPPLLIEKNSVYSIVSGFRRITVCQKLNWNEVDVRLLDPETNKLDCLRLAIADNALQRPLNLIETSRCLHKLALNLDNDRQLAESASSLGLPSNPAIIAKIKSLCLLPRPIQRSILTETISLATAKELEFLEPDSALSLTRLFDQLKIGLNKQREIITLVKEIARRDSLAIEAVMEDKTFIGIIDDHNLDRGQKIRKLRAFLRQRRYPRIAETEKRFDMNRRNLKLGEDINLVPPKDFEANTYSLNLTFTDLTHLRSLQKKLDKIIQDPLLKEILDR